MTHPLQLPANKHKPHNLHSQSCLSLLKCKSHMGIAYMPPASMNEDRTKQDEHKISYQIVFREVSKKMN